MDLSNLTKKQLLHLINDMIGKHTRRTIEGNVEITIRCAKADLEDFQADRGPSPCWDCIAIGRRLGLIEKA